MAEQPNILFIVLDTQRRDRLPLYGHRVDTAPNLSDFAQDATVFERAIAPAQWTIPSHASLFTGVYPSTHQLTQAFQQLSGAHPTLAEILQLEDFHTVAFCNNPLLGVLDHGLQRGFNEFYNYAGASPNRPVDQTRSLLRRQFATRFRRLAQDVTNQFAHSDLLFRVALNPLLARVWSRLANFKGDTERSIDDLIDYWAQHHAGGAEKPLFAFLNLMGTHTPYRPPANHLDHVAKGLRHDKQATRYMTRFNADAGQWISPEIEPMQEWQARTLEGFYDAEIAHQDEHLGRLFRYLETSGALENTLVIISADHGEGHGDHGFHGHSFVVYQELVHVPLIVRFPDRFPAGKRIKTNVSTRRIFHTVLDLLDVEPPLAEDDPNADIRGLSLVSSLNGRPDTERGIAFAEAIPPLNLLNILEAQHPALVDQLYLKQIRRGVYQDDHKLALVGNRVEKLFDVARDPAEVEDLAAQHPEVVAALQDRMHRFVDEAKSQRMDTVVQGAVSDEVLDNLRALGYLE